MPNNCTVGCQERYAKYVEYFELKTKKTKGEQRWLAGKRTSWMRMRQPEQPPLLLAQDSLSATRTVLSNPPSRLPPCAVQCMCPASARSMCKPSTSTGASPPSRAPPAEPAPQASSQLLVDAP